MRYVVKFVRLLLMRSYLLIGLGGAAFFLSWFLPVVKDGVCLPDGLPGWQALLCAITLGLNPGGEGASQTAGLLDWYHSGVALLSVASNLIALGALIALAAQWRRGTPSRLLAVLGWACLIACIVDANWYLMLGGGGMGDSGRQDLRVGYYLWCLSFAPLGIGLLALSLRRRAFSGRSDGLRDSLDLSKR